MLLYKQYRIYLPKESKLNRCALFIKNILIIIFFFNYCRAGRTRKPSDQNSATHLIRHALGGTDYGIEHSKIAYYLSLPQDVVRLYRDDITITVIYFNSDRINDLSHRTS